MKTLKSGIVSLMSLFLFFACGEVEYVLPGGGGSNGNNGGNNGSTVGEVNVPVNDLPVFFFDIVTPGNNGTVNTANAPVSMLGDLRAELEVSPYYMFKDDTLLNLQSSVFTQAYFSNMGIPEANLNDVFWNLLKAEITSVSVCAVALDAQNQPNWNINGQINNFYIQMKWGQGLGSSLDAGYLSGGAPLNYTLKTTYTASINSSNPNDRRIIEIFLLAIDLFWNRQPAYFYTEGWTNVDYGTKMRYYFTVTGNLKFSMHLREN